MKKNIHPQVHTDCKVTCVCGNTFNTISTQKEISVEICSKCHPYFTGTQKFVDTEGRIDKFTKKLKLSDEKKEAAKSIVKKGAKAKEDTKKTLKDLLNEAKQPE